MNAKINVPSGIIDQALAISQMFQVPIRIVSIGPFEDQSGDVCTFVRLQISGLPFETILVGKWTERDKDFGTIVTAFVGLLNIVQRRPMIC